MFNDLKSLQGTWSTRDGAKFNENWTFLNDSTLIGIGFSLRDKDTLFAEQLKIYRTGNDVYYAALVSSNQNYVDFRLEEASNNTWKFVNLDHDYPNIIQYTLINDSLLEAKTMNIRGGYCLLRYCRLELFDRELFAKIR